MTEEYWLPVVGYEGLYEVSDQGRVWSVPRPGVRGGMRKLSIAKTGGYWTLALSKDGHSPHRKVHRLVMEAFVGPCPDGMEVRHLDGDPRNARLTNLTYGTSAENKHDQRRHGTNVNASRTHCPQGHPYDEANTYVFPRNGSRQCRTCHRMHSLAYSRRRQGPASRSLYEE